jgi:hypothetical protein
MIRAQPLAAAVGLLLITACGRPIELVEEGVVALSGTLPVAPDDLPADAADTLQLTAVVEGFGAETPIEIAGDGTFEARLLYNVDEEREVTLRLTLTGGRSAREAPVLLGRHVGPQTAIPRDEVEVTLAATDFDTDADEGTDAYRFDVNRNDKSNLVDLTENDPPCAPGVPGRGLALSATDLQFPSGVDPGDFSRQVVVVDNLTEHPIDYWVKVVGAPGILISPLDVESLTAPVPQSSIGGEGEDERLTLAAGEEALIAATFAPTDSTLTTGFLIVESVDRCQVRQAGAVRLIANTDGAFAPEPEGFDPSALTPPSELGIDDALPVDTNANSHLYDGEQVTLEGLPAEMDPVTVGGQSARAATLVRLPAATRLGIGLVDLSRDADLTVFPIEGGELGEPIVSVHAGDDEETLVIEPASVERELLVVVTDVPVDDQPAQEAFSLFFRAFAVPGFADPAITPTTGPVEGGTEVTIFGAGFRPDAEVLFAGAPAGGVTVNGEGTQITALTPEGTLLPSLNPATLVVRNPAEGGSEPQYATLPQAFVYAPSAPVLETLDPASGVIDSPHLVLIRGSGFTEFFGSPVQVDFGGVAATTVQVLSPTQILANVPAASTPSAVPVTVRLYGPGDEQGSPSIEATLPAAFTWVAPLPDPPTVASIAPPAIAADSNELISITGTDFVDGARVLFKPASGADISAFSTSYVDATSLTAVTPALPAGSYAVIAENPDGQRAANQPTLTVQETAVADPVISTLSPASVHALVAGDTLTLLGQNLASQPITALAITDGSSDYAASLVPPVVDAFATVRIDDPLPAGSDFQVRVTYGALELLSPKFVAFPPSVLETQIIGGVAVEGQAFSLLITGQQLNPDAIVGVRFDGPETLTVMPGSATENNVRVDVATLLQGTYDVTVVYPGGFEVLYVSGFYVDGDCGDGMKSTNEECDLTDLGTADCVSEGFVGGQLTCNSDCTLNTSLCDSCGNGTLDSGEECDGTDFGGATCDSLGFSTGDLACDPATCSVLVGDCSLCGDDIAEDNEMCDGDDLRNQTCQGLGFSGGGTLACESDCSAYDATLCEECGDGICSGTETSSSCVADCLPTCNDGNDTCDSGETCGNCPTDCDVCVPFSATLVEGDGQNAVIGQAAATPILIRVTDTAGDPVPGAILTSTIPPGGRVLGDTSGATSVTNANGEASFRVTIGFVPGTYSVTITGIGPSGAALDQLPMTVDIQADDVPVGTIYTLVNAFGAAAWSPDASGAAQFSRVYSPHGVYVEDDGTAMVTIYNSHRVIRVSPDGALTHYAGNGAQGFDGEAVPAPEGSAGYPTDVEPDGEGGYYISANGITAGRVRHVDASGVITTYAGRQTDDFPDRGDDGPAIDAYLADPTSLTTLANGDLAIADANASGGRYTRRVDKDTGVITTFIFDSSTCELDGATANNSVPRFIEHDGDTLYGAWDVGSNTVTACTPTRSHLGAKRDDSDSVFSIGAVGNILFGLTVDAAGNLYTWNETTRRLLKVDRFGDVSVIAGTGAPGYDGDYGPAVDATLYGVRGLAMSPSGDLFIADFNNHTVRVIRGIGETVAPQATLEVISTGPFVTETMRSHLPITLRALIDGAPVAGTWVDATIAHGHRIDRPSQYADGFGEINATMWTGFAPDDYTFDARVFDRVGRFATPPLTVTVTATAHAVGTVAPVLNHGAITGGSLTGSASSTRLNDPRGLGVLPTGEVVVADRSNQRVLRVNLDGTVDRIAGNGVSNAFAVNGLDAATQPFPYPSGLAVSDDGEIYVAVAASGVDWRVYKIDLDGKAIHVAGGGVGTGDDIVATSASLSAIYALDYDDATDNLYFTEVKTIREVDSAGFIRRLPFDITGCSPSLVGPMQGLHALANGKLAIGMAWNGYCAGYGKANALIEVDKTTGLHTEIGPATLERSGNVLNDAATSPVDGLVYYETRYEIMRTELDGSTTSITGTHLTQGNNLGPEPAGPSALINDPRGIAFDAAGNLYFNEGTGGTIRMIARPDQL